MTDLTQQARELLAAEYEREGILYMSDLLRARGEQLTTYEERAVRAIEAALRTRTPDAGGKDAAFDALKNARDWFEAQAKSISKGNGSSWDLMQVREQRDLCDAAIAQLESN